MSVRTKCINCGRRRACLKIEAHVPLRRPRRVLHRQTVDAVPICRVEIEEYEPGPMVEICRACLRTDIGTLARHLESEAI